MPIVEVMIAVVLGGGNDREGGLESEERILGLKLALTLSRDAESLPGRQARL